MPIIFAALSLSPKFWLGGNHSRSGSAGSRPRGETAVDDKVGFYALGYVSHSYRLANDSARPPPTPLPLYSSSGFHPSFFFFFPFGDSLPHFRWVI